MGNKNLNEVFPGYENQPGKFLRLSGIAQWLGNSFSSKTRVGCFAETISSGENPRRHASQSVISKSTIVITTFVPCVKPPLASPGQVAAIEENGAR